MGIGGDHGKIMIVCATCGSSDIKQEASIMLDPNSKEDPKLDDFHWEDYIWCDKCEDECEPIEEEVYTILFTDKV